MTQIATVEEKLRPGFVRIAVRRESACGHDCEHCGGCGAAAGQVLRVEAVDPLDTAPGEKVIVESSTGQVLRAAALVYLLPLITLIVGYALGESLGGTAMQVGAAAVGLLAGLLPAVLLDRRTRRHNQAAFRILQRL